MQILRDMYSFVYCECAAADLRNKRHGCRFGEAKA